MPLYNPGLPLVGTGQTVTVSTPLLDLTQTWNAGAVTFTGRKFNVTATASATGSLLDDLQVGGVSQFSVSKAGRVLIGSGTTALPAMAFQTRVGAGWSVDDSLGGQGAYVIGSTEATSQISFGASIGFQVIVGYLGIGGSIGAADTIFTRKAAANWQLGNVDANGAPVAQTLSVQSAVNAGPTNQAGANTTFKASAGTGTGVGGNFIWQVAPAGSSGVTQNTFVTGLTLDTNGQLVFARALAGPIPVTASGTTYTLLVTDYSMIFTNAGTVTVTLPAASSFPGRMLYFKSTGVGAIVSASSNVVPRIGGAAGVAILAALAGSWAFLHSDGTNWVIMAGA